MTKASKKKPLDPKLKAENDALARIWDAKKREVGMSQAKFSEIADISSAGVSHYIRGINALNLNIASLFAKVLDVDIAEFSPRLAGDLDGLSSRMSRDTTRDPNANVGTGRTITIPRYMDGAGEHIRASMGYGSSNGDSYIDVFGGLSVDESWLRQNVNFTTPSNLAIVTGYGDSMEGTFSDGDVLLVDRGVTEIKLDAVYVLSMGDELYIKRLQRRPDGIVLMISDNPKYPPYEIEGADRKSFKVEGRVLLVWNARKL